MLHFIIDLIKYVFPFVFIASIILLIRWDKKSKEDQDKMKADKSFIGKIYNGLISAGMFFVGAAGSNSSSDNQSYHDMSTDNDYTSSSPLETDVDEYYECDDDCYIDLDEEYDLTEEDTDE